MISMIWMSQTALRFADSDLFTTILCCLLVMGLVLSFKSDEGGGGAELFQYLIAGCLYIFTKYTIWNKNTLPQEERETVNPKKEKKKAKESSQPVVVENPKRKQKKNRRPAKKSVSKENKEPTVPKKETKLYDSLEMCEKLNRDEESIYNQLYSHILTETQLRMNHFPHESYHPWTQVEADNSNRTCVRCGKLFEIYNGLYLSDSLCHYHPGKATFRDGFHVKFHGCCDAPVGSPPCATYNSHVTVQHRRRQLEKTSSRRHVRKDLQFGVYSLDCEMSYTTDGLEVVRVGLVNLNGHAVYDGFVKPKNKILDYNTTYSGVTQVHLQNVTVTLDDVKKILRKHIYEDTILVGHAINNDLAALGLIHNTVVDTSVLFTDPFNPTKKIALKTLASRYLGMKIQDGPSGHDCIDDARACLQLALLKVPASVPRPLPEKTDQHLVAEGQCYEQQPLVEVQNFPHLNQSFQNDPLPTYEKHPWNMSYYYNAPLHRRRCI